MFRMAHNGINTLCAASQNAPPTFGSSFPITSVSKLIHKETCDNACLPVSLFTNYNPFMSPLALVTGAAHRLGKTFALTLAQHGFDILLHYHHSLDAALLTRAEIESRGSRVPLAPADLTDPAQIQSLFSNLQSLDVLVNSAAFMPSGNVDALSIENWDTSLDLNLRAPFLLAQEASKKMTAGGLIVNIT